MKSVFVRIVFLILLIEMAGSRRLWAQPVYSIRVNVQIAPPYSAYIEDYRSKSILSFTNLSQTPADVYLRGMVKNDRGEFIQTKPNIFTLVPIHVPGGQTVVVQGSQVDGSYLDLNNLQTNLTNSEYSNLFQLGLIPEGFYTFCIYAYTRNATGNYVPVSDPQAGGACSMFNIGYVVPPTILSPVDQSQSAVTPNQNLNILWTRPVGNVQGAQIVYDLWLVKVLEGEDANTALNASVQYGSGIFFKQANIMTPNFQFTNLTGFSLEPGSSYALMIQARDLTGKTAFENNGRSGVVSFFYGAQPVEAIGPMQTLSAVNCTCRTDLSSADPTNGNNALKPGGNFTMNGLTMRIATLGATNGDGSVSGTGTVLIDHVPVMVQWQNLVVNPGGVAIAGVATGISSPDFSSLLGGTGPPVISTTTGFQSFIDQISKYNINVPGNAVGLPLPFGLNTLGAPDQFNIGVTALTITPTQSYYDAVGVTQLIDAQSVLSMAASHVCFSSASLFCGDAQFSLAQDLVLPPIGLTLKAPLGADMGTFAIDSAGTVTQLHIEAVYTFPGSVLTKPDGSPAQATLNADIAHSGWSDWIASVTLDPFIIPAVGNSVVFQQATGFYDHSTTRNASGMPSSLSDPDLAQKNPEIGTSLWEGFYLPTLKVSLPALVADVNDPGDNMTVAVNDLFIDGGGVTGVLQANNVIPITAGSLGGWYCSLDLVSLKFLNSSFINGGMYGNVVMPFSDVSKQNSQISWSCTLSANGAGGGLAFQFVATQQHNIDFSAWWATIDIRNFSLLVSNAGGKFDASASISGTLNFNPNIGGYSASLNLIEVDSLVVQTQAPYVSAKTAHFGLSSPQHSFDGFPVSISNVEPDFSSGAGLAFDINVSLTDLLGDNAGLDATGRFVISANINPLPRVTWTGVGVHCDSVTVDGDLKVAKISGAVAFLNSDPTFGNCVRGSLTAQFAGLPVTVGVDAVFGNTTFNYWYLDAKFTWVPGVFLAPGLNLNSIGGGAFYNMAKQVNSQTIDQVFAKNYLDNYSSYQVGQYTPNQGMVGFTAMLGLSSNDGGFLYSGYGQFGMTFDLSNGFSVSSLDLTFFAEMLKSTPGNDGDAVMQGVISGHIGIADNVFSITGALKISYPPVGPSILNGNAALALLADKGNNVYYFKLGEPDNRNELKVMDVLDFKSYFMAGNTINAAIPDPDPDIVDVSKIPNYRKLVYDPNNPPGGMVFGASFDWSQSLNYLVFYVKIGMGIGFDISLAHYTQGCGGTTNPGSAGANSWYAMGQVYASLKGEIGLGVDLWFFHGNAPAGEVDAGVLLQAGLPNPNWFEGYAYLNFNALDGLITGTVNFHLQIGDVCVPGRETLSLPLIAEFKPADQASNVPINADPEVVFNYPANQQFNVWTLNSDGSGDSTLHTFFLNIADCEVVNTATNQVYASNTDPQSNAYFVDDQHKDLMMVPLSAMDGQTKYQFNVQVQALDVTGGAYTDIADTTASVSFTTGYCKPDQLVSSSTSRLGAFPYPGQRYFLPGESKQGAIILDKSYECGEAPGEQYTLIARFTSLRAHQALHVDEMPVALPLNGNFLKYNLPSFPNDCLVRVEIIKRTVLSQQDSYTLFGSNPPALTSATRALAQNPGGNLTISQSGYSAAVAAAGVNFTSMNSNHQLQLSGKTMDIILYTYHFRTSHFNTLADKMKNVYYIATTNYDADLIGGSPTMTLTAAEKFDYYDINGFVSTTYSGNFTYFTLPLVNFRENAHYNQWMADYAIPCIYNKYNALGLNLDNTRNYNNSAYYLYLQHVGLACNGTLNCIPRTPIEVITYDPVITDQEIAADEVPAYLNSKSLNGTIITKL